MSRPDAQLLGNGDILVPVEDDGGGWRMSRLTSDDADYAATLAAIQERDRRPGVLERGLGFWGAGLLLLVGFWALLIVAALATRIIS